MNLCFFTINSHLNVRYSNVYLLYGPFGASVVLYFCAPKAPFSQPWNAIAGQAVSSFVGVSVRLIAEAHSVDLWIQKPVAVSIAIFLMCEFDCLYPPAGATALLAIIGGPKVYEQDYRFVLYVGKFGGCSVQQNNESPLCSYSN